MNILGKYIVSSVQGGRNPHSGGNEISEAARCHIRYNYCFCINTKALSLMCGSVWLNAFFFI